jgi:hypothetical protein
MHSFLRLQLSRQPLTLELDYQVVGQLGYRIARNALQVGYRYFAVNYRNRGLFSIR